MRRKWAELESLMHLEQRHRLVESLADLDDASRKSLVKPLRAYARSGDYDLPPNGSEVGLSLAGPALLPNTRAVSAWLRRFPPSSPTWGGQFTAEPGLIARVLLTRQASWLPALVADLAERLRFDNYGTGPFELIDLLRKGLGIAAPDEPPFVAMWFEHRLRDTLVLEALAAEPEYAALIPRVFEEDGVAATLRREPHLTAALTNGSVDRAEVLDAALARLQRGGRPQATNDVVAVLRTLDPTTAEIGARLADYLALLAPGTASTAAGLAQELLFAAHREGTIATAELLDASGTVLARSEKKLLRAQLAWLEEHLSANPEDADAVVTAATVAIDCPASDIAGRAAALLKRAGAHAESAPPDVGTGTLPQAAAPTPVRPIEHLDEAVEHLLIVLRTVDFDRLGVDVERLVEALLRLVNADGPGLPGVRHRFVNDPMYVWALRLNEWEDAKSLSVVDALVALVAELVGEGGSRPPLSVGRSLPPPERALALRLVDLADAVRVDGRVRVVSLPTDSTGALDAQVLEHRLRTAAEEGWAPAPLDLELARLRADPVLHPPPRLSVEVTLDERRNTLPWATPIEPRAITRLRIEPVPAVDEHTLWGILAGGPPHTLAGRWTTALWPLLLPHHPGLVAAYLVPELAAGATGRSHGLEALLHLAESTYDDGSGSGEAVTLTVAHALNAADAAARAVAIDAMLALAARGHLHGAVLGHRLAVMVGQGEVTSTRLPAALLDAARAGATAQVWECMSALLGDLLAGVVTAGTRVAGLGDLLDRAADVANLVPRPGPVPHLQELAARPGRSRQVVAARHLTKQLAPQS